MKKILYIFVSATVLMVLFGWPFFWKVKTVCVSQYGECNSQTASNLSKENGKTLFFAKDDAEKMLKSDYLVSEFSLQFKLPDILLVNIIEKKPVFALSNKNSNKVALVSAKGEVLSLASVSSLPEVDTTIDLPKLGESVGNTNLFALKLIGGVFEMYQVRQGEIQNDTLVVDLPGTIRVIFPLDGDTQVLLGSLKLIYTRLAGDLAGKYSQIDLRFKNPVIR